MKWVAIYGATIPAWFGLVVAMLGEALGEEIVRKFAGLFETIDPFFNDKVHPSVMIKA